MISTKVKTLRLGLALLGSGTAIAAAPAAGHAQQYAPQQEDSGTALTRHLRTLAEQPRSLSALTGAGRAALELGDPQAALTFFARAEEIAPRDGRVKAGMGSVFLAMEQPRTAMRLFTEAASLGVPEAEFSGDRGLVYDLDGDPRRAQADYARSLSRQENDEVRRRLALSLAISGDRARALATIDAQLRRQDRAAWRTRAFILALTGDPAGAIQVAQSTIPAQASQLQPFFARLASLSPSQRAMAVNFGHFPEDGRPMPSNGSQYASAAPAPAASTASAATQAGRPDARQPAFGTTRSAAPARATPAPTQTASRERPERERRKPGVSREKPQVMVGRRIQLPPTAVAEPSAATPPAVQPPAASSQPAPAADLGALVQNLPAEMPAATPPPAPAPTAEPGVIEVAQAEPREQEPSSSIQKTELPPSNLQAPQPARQEAAAPAPAGVGSTFAGIAAAIAALPEEKPPAEPAPKPIRLAEAKAAPPPAAKASLARPPATTAAKESKPAAKPETAKKPGSEKPAAVKREAAPKEPSRNWVQIAGGANEAAMNNEFKRIKAKAPKLLAGKTPWTTPLKATNRLLVGPFKTPREAQDFVNELAKLDLSAFTWTSPAGQEIVKLASK